LAAENVLFMLLCSELRKEEKIPNFSGLLPMPQKLAMHFILISF
jgi:hypothetical protein